MSWLNPIPPDMPLRIPRRYPKNVVPSFIGESGQVLNLLIHHGAGGVVRDYSPYGNHGTIYGARWVDCEWGWALYFNGESAYVEVPDSPSLRVGSSDFTLIALIKVQSTGTIQEVIGKWRTGSWRRYELRVDSDGRAMALLYVTEDKYAKSSRTVDDDMWHFLVGVFDRDESIKIYVDGVLDGIYEGDNSGDIGTDLPLQLSKGPHDRWVRGLIALALVYRGLLSEERIEAMTSLYL